MDTRHLRNFLKITEMGSISRAADALGLAQPSLSQQVLRLEDEIGCKLFRRTPRGIITTDAGRVLEKHARDLLQIAEHALEDVRQVRKEAGSRVVIAMPFSISRLLSVPLTEAAMAEIPPISLRVREAFSGTIRSMLQAGDVDLALLYDTEPLNEFEIKRLARDNLYLIGSSSKLATMGIGATIPPSELNKLPLILPGPAHPLRVRLDQTAHSFGFRLTIASEIDSLEHIVGLLADGHGLSILPLSAIENELRSGAISVVRIDGLIGGTLFLARLRQAATSDASCRIEDLIINLLRNLIQKRRWLARPDVDIH